MIVVRPAAVRPPVRADFLYSSQKADGDSPPHHRLDEGHVTVLSCCGDATIQNSYRHLAGRVTIRACASETRVAPA